MKRAWGGRWGQTSTWQQRRAAAAKAAAARAAAAKANAKASGADSSSSSPGGADAAAAASQQQQRPRLSPPTWGNSAANAYMLMYRRVDPQRNKRHLRREEVPEHVAHQVREHDRRVAEAEARAAAEREAIASSVTLKVLLNGGPEERIVKGDKRRPLRELVDRIAAAFDVPAVAPPPLPPPALEMEEGGAAGEEGGGGGAAAAAAAAMGGGKEATRSDGRDSVGGQTDPEAQDEEQSDETGSPTGGRPEAGKDTEERVGAKESSNSADGEGGVAVPTAAAPPNKKLPDLPPVRLVRLRDYLAGPRLPGAALDEHSSPAELLFSNQKKVWLETRKAGERWPRFDRNDVNVAVVRFEPALPEAPAPAPAPATTGDKDYEELYSSPAGGGDGGGSSGGAAESPPSAGQGWDAGGSAIPPPPPLPPALYPVLGRFRPERNTRMKASGTVRQVRAAFAAFAGTDERRTRVFTMRMDTPEATYKVLCQPPCRSEQRQRLRRRRRDAAAAAGVVEVTATCEDGDTAGVLQTPAVADGSGVGFTTAKALVEAGAEAASPGNVAEPAASTAAAGAAAAVNVVNHEQHLSTPAATGPQRGAVAGESGSSGIVPDDESEEEEKDEQEEREDRVIVLGERGSNLILRIYVEEVPEEDETEEDGVSLAVKVATDQPNR